MFLFEAIEHMRKFVNTEPMKKIGVDFSNVTPYTKFCSQHVFDTKDFWECYIRSWAVTVYHPTTTCRMGDSSDPTAVVDPQLRYVVLIFTNFQYNFYISIDLVSVTLINCLSCRLKWHIHYPLVGCGQY